MIDKLAELAELAPDICIQVAPTIFKIRIRVDDTTYTRNIYPATSYNSLSAVEDTAWLQVALQQAIESDWRLVKRGTEYVAEIWPPVRYGVGASPAEALLDALLTAVRETGK